MPTKYFAATAPDGAPVVRSTASREYVAASLVKRPEEGHWRSSWSSTRALAEKVNWYRLPGDVLAVVDAREVTRAEYLRLKAEWDRTVRK